MRRAPLPRAPALGVLLLVAGTACGAGAEDALLREPPRLASLASFDEEVARRIEEACARVSEAPDDAAVWAELGTVYEVERVRTQALVCYDQALTRAPHEPRWWYRTAVVQWRLGDLEDATRRMERTIVEEPGYAPAHYRLGGFHLELGRLGPAWEAFVAADECDPEFAGGRVGMARVLLQRDSASEAVALLEGLRARDPDDPTVLRLLATAYRQAGRGDDALALGTEGAVHGGDPAGVLWHDPWQSVLMEHRRAPDLRLARRLLNDGQVVRALEILERERAENPEDTTFLLSLAQAYFQVGRIQDARRTYREQLELEPDNVNARIGLAMVHEAEELPHLAVAKLDEVIAIQPNYARAWEQKGRVLCENDQFDMAVPVLEHALELDQRNPDVWLWLGHSLLALDRWEDALRAYTSLVEREPSSGDAWLGVAKARVKLRELDGAEEALRMAEEHGTRTPGVLRQVRRSIRTVRERDARRARQEQGV